MANLDADSRKYLSRVKHELKLYSLTSKKQIIQILTNDLMSYKEVEPLTDYEQLCRHFGRPDKFVDNILDVADSDALRKKTAQKRKTTFIFIILLFTISIATALILFAVLSHNVSHTTDSTVVYINNET